MLTGTASPLSRGLTCCGTVPAARLGLRAARHRPVDRDLIASSVAGILWTTVSPEVAFIFLAAAMVIAAPLILITLRKSARPLGGGCLSATRRYTIHSAITPMALDAALLKGPLLDVLRA
jgi:hypothetical protein